MLGNCNVEQELSRVLNSLEAASKETQEAVLHREESINDLYTLVETLPDAFVAKHARQLKNVVDQVTVPEGSAGKKGAIVPRVASTYKMMDLMKRIHGLDPETVSAQQLQDKVSREKTKIKLLNPNLFASQPQGVISPYDKFLIISSGLPELAERQVARKDTFNFWILNAMLDDQLRMDFLLDCKQMYKVSEECMRMHGNKEIVNKIKSVL